MSGWDQVREGLITSIYMTYHHPYISYTSYTFFEGCNACIVTHFRCTTYSLQSPSSTESATRVGLCQEKWSQVLTSLEFLVNQCRIRVFARVRWKSSPWNTNGLSRSYTCTPAITCFFSLLIFTCLFVIGLLPSSSARNSKCDIRKTVSTECGNWCSPAARPGACLRSKRG